MSELGHTGASDQSQAGDATTSSDQGGLNLSKPLVAGGLTVAALAGFAGGYGVKDAVDHHDTRPEQVQHEPNASRTMLADLNFSVGNKRVEVTGWKGANGDVEVSTGGDPSAGKLVTELYGQGGEKVGKAEVTPGENAQLALGKDNTPDNQLGVWKENGLPDFLVSLPRDGIEKNTGFGVIMSAGDGNNKLIDVDAVRGSDNTLSIGVNNTESGLPISVSAKGPGFSQELYREGAGINTEPNGELEETVSIPKGTNMLEIQSGTNTIDLPLNNKDGSDQ